MNKFLRLNHTKGGETESISNNRVDLFKTEGGRVGRLALSEKKGGMKH
jgi:hypothetical protein